jgi:hypothetical protein
MTRHNVCGNMQETYACAPCRFNITSTILLGDFNYVAYTNESFSIFPINFTYELCPDIVLGIILLHLRRSKRFGIKIISQHYIY